MRVHLGSSFSVGRRSLGELVRGVSYVRLSTEPDRARRAYWSAMSPNDPKQTFSCHPIACRGGQGITKLTRPSVDRLLEAMRVNNRARRGRPGSSFDRRFAALAGHSRALRAQNGQLSRDLGRKACRKGSGMRYRGLFFSSPGFWLAPSSCLLAWNTRAVLASAEDQARWSPIYSPAAPASQTDGRS
jgi:hypothetical protein